ncbi:MAG TPA: alpha/beta fold hydrolase [Mycobacteriales bacterium]|nr:alpha/beta fold hydrolase [Mycobacteriales bacterium]
MRPVSIRRETHVVHGYRRAYLLAGPRLGTAPVLWLIHGIGDSSRTWEPVLPLLAAHHTVVAPDLLGHGASDKPRADYSIGGFANGVRDLQVVLGVESATIVGHSLGGGVAMQFAYQFPERVERMVLVSSGGLGAEVNPLLRGAAIPGASYVIAATAQPRVQRAMVGIGRRLARLGLLDTNDVEDVAIIWEGLRDEATRKAFLRTLRAVIDVRGQAVTSHDRLYLAADVPVMLIWGDRDPIVPVSHAALAAEALPHARLSIVPRSGHMPHRSEPEAFAAAVREFVADTVPARHDPSEIRERLVAGRQAAVTKSINRSTLVSNGTSRSV